RAANVTGLFENPHVVEVYGTELGDTISYSVTEWLEGSTLAREVARVGRLPVRDALKLVIPCMRAVVEAHAAGVVHGDIRPAHIFLCRATRHLPERARVFDFGRGAPGFHELRLPARVEVDEFCRYAPPELLCGGVLDTRSDIYGFGLLLYEVISGERIFVEDDLFDLLREIERGPKRAIGDVTETMPRGLTEVLYRAMSVRPDERYQDLAVFLDELLPFASHNALPAPLTNVSTDQPVVSSPRRLWHFVEAQLKYPRRMQPVLSGAALVAAVLGLGHLAFDNGSSDEARSDSPMRPVTSQHAAVRAEPDVSARSEHEHEHEHEHVIVREHDLVIPDPLPVAGSVQRTEQPTHVSTQPSSRRVRGRSERRRAQAEVPTAPASNEPAAPPVETVTPLERMELQ
ncbi:MAG TPA: protein kinase, partial [Polyangiales bacterium]|nr:protein kinase [Polyangiales bacterium]